MNKPRNRQARPPRNNDRRPQRGTPRNNDVVVPSIQQVKPGAHVSIVLKADQPTGREVQGIVQDLLTRGDHPRGIKVRLKDGHIGRVQRMADGANASDAPNSELAPSRRHVLEQVQGRRISQDGDEYDQTPPTRTLGDFLSDGDGKRARAARPPTEEVAFSSAMVKCPICGTFEGHEAAVQHHIQEHLDG